MDTSEYGSLMIPLYIHCSRRSKYGTQACEKRMKFKVDVKQPYCKHVLTATSPRFHDTSESGQTVVCTKQMKTVWRLIITKSTVQLYLWHYELTQSRPCTFEYNTKPKCTRS